MTVLAIECSSAERSVALTRDHAILAERTFRAGQSTPLLEMVQACLASAGSEPRDIGILAVGLGPGSYTGIRTALAVAQGWHLAHTVRLIGIDSATACAHRAHRLGHRGPCAVVIDAQRDEFYLATFDLTPTGPHPLQPLRLASRTDVEATTQLGFRLLGPELPANCGLTYSPVNPDAASIAELALARTDDKPPQALEPIYLRPTTFVKAPTPAAPRPPEPSAT